MTKTEPNTRQAYVDFVTLHARESGRLIGRLKGGMELQRTWLATTLERLGDRGSPVVKFASYSELAFYADHNHFKNEPLGDGRKAVLLTQTVLDRVVQVWVAKSAEDYRKHMLAWLERVAGLPSESDHLDAVKCICDMIVALEKKRIRPKLGKAARKKVRDQLCDHLLAHAKAAADCKPDSALFKYFDGVIDADHVLPRSALASQPDAWVLLMPVPAPANRMFGSVVESKIVQVDNTRGDQDLSSEMLFKVLAGFVPSTEEELTDALKHVRGQLLKGIHHRYVPRMEAVMRAVRKNGLPSGRG